MVVVRLVRVVAEVVVGMIGWLKGDAGDKCGVGAKLVARVGIIPCSVRLDCGAETVVLVVNVPCSVILDR